MSNSPARDVAILLSKEYTKSYSPGGVYSAADVTMSALDLALMPQFEKSIADLSTTLQTLSAAQLKTAASTADATLGFALSDYKDTGDFVTKMAPNFEKGAQQNVAINNVMDALSKVVISNDVTQNYALAHGLSIWLPGINDFSSYSSRYSGLKFEKATGWGRFLALMNKN